MARREVTVYHDYDPYLLLSGIPNCRGASPTLGEFRLNAHGFRSREIGEKRGPRWVVIGGSTVWGSAASDNDATFPAQLERKLREDTGAEVEVINAGIGAFFSFQELVLIAHRIVYLAPDLVILFNGYNDLQFSTRIPERDYVYNEIETYLELKRFLTASTTGKDFTRMIPLRRELPRLLRQRLASTAMGGLLRRVRGRVERMVGPSSVPEVARAVQRYAPNHKAVRNYLTNMEMAVDILHGQGVDAIVALQPYLPLSRKTLTPDEHGWLDEEREKPGKIGTLRVMYERLENGLKDLERTRRIETYSFVGVFDDEPATCFADFVHPNDRGYRLIGERMARLTADRLQSRTER